MMHPKFYFPAERDGTERRDGGGSSRRFGYEKATTKTARAWRIKPERLPGGCLLYRLPVTERRRREEVS